MEVLEAIRARRSIRGFRPEPVPQAVLREILETATRAPSDVNIQPWFITVLAGEPLQRVRRARVELLDALPPGTPYPGAHTHKQEGVYRQRQVELGKALFGLVGIAREDKEGRAEWVRRGMRYFDAPAVIVLSVESPIEEYRYCFALATLTQNICLAAMEYGLGTCIQRQGVAFPEVYYQYGGIPAGRGIVITIALGYPDAGYPANRLVSPRAPLDEVAEWVGF